MLTALAIRDLVLIEQLSLDLEPGLAVLTGETGAGKSILLDALGLALGARAEGRLVRSGARQAQVTASFDLPDDHPALLLADEENLAEPGEPLLLRRSVTPEGRSRAFVNDQPVSAGLLRRMGDLLVEIQGQFEQRGLLDAGRHRGLLDAYGGLQEQAADLAQLHRAWRQAAEALETARAGFLQAQEEEEELRHQVEELEALAPQEGEEAALAEERQALLHHGAIVEALEEAQAALFTSGKGEAQLVQALRALERVADKAGERLQPLLECLERSLAEVEEAGRLLAGLSADSDLDPNRLEAVEERFFALKDLARKHAVSADELPALWQRAAARLELVSGGESDLACLQNESAAAEAAFRAAARDLTSARQAAAGRLDKAVMAELAPLKLERAQFQTAVTPLEESAWGAKGAEEVQFLVATNPGSPPGPLGKVASGGELARFLLAIRVVLARLGAAETLVFDEVDAGVGGATAAAVGARLARLAGELQVLVVTHSPQVAARGGQHLQVAKGDVKGAVRTEVAALGAEARLEEIARMLSGAEITPEARKAAAKLLEGQR
ncbi:MAG: DNA repair protein RecN [Pseudomonadota bacterium]